MSSVTASAVVRQIESLFDGSSVAGLSDRQLVERFTARRDAAGEAAFTALVTRHGPMVMDICRQLLGDLHDAEDAFQAVFLVLARRAPSIRDPDLLANWLFGVALRTARQAKSRSAPMLSNGEGNVMPGSRTLAGVRVEPTDQPADCSLIAREQTEALYQEIDCLPRPFRRTIVLHYFEGLTLEETARRLRCPAGTVRSRLARACEKLRRGLTRRGFALSSAAIASLLLARSASASVSLAVCETTSRAAVQFVAKQATAGVLSAAAIELAQKVLHSLLLSKLKISALGCLLLGAIIVGAAFIGQATGRQAGKPDLLPIAKSGPAVAKAAPGRMFVTGRVLDPEGNPVPNAATMVYAHGRSIGPLLGWAGRRPLPIGDASADRMGMFHIDAPRTSSSGHDTFAAVAIAPGFGLGCIDLDPDAAQPSADITLRPEHAIRGRLLDVHGQPVPGVTISVYEIAPITYPQRLPGALQRAEGVITFWWENANEFAAWPRPATSDAEGRFTVHGIGRNQRTRLAIHHPKFALQDLALETDDAAESKPLTFVLQPAKIITGRVIYADTGKPVAHAVIAVQPNLRRGTGMEVHSYFESDADGQFRVNPRSADRYFVSAWPASDEPYLTVNQTLDWPKGAIEHSLKFALPRGVAIHGKVTEEGSGAPIAGAAVNFLPRTRRQSQTDPRTSSRMTSTAPDGSFQLGAIPGPGRLFIAGPTDDYVLQLFGDRPFDDDRPRPPLIYSHGHLLLDVNPEVANKEVHVRLRRGLTVKGQVVGPDGRGVEHAWLFSRVILQPVSGGSRNWFGGYHSTSTRDGHFEIHGLEPDVPVAVHFLDPKRKLGTTAVFSGQSAARGPVTVRLEPCGSARARLVNREGQPFVGQLPLEMLTMVVTTGPAAPLANDKSGSLLAGENDLDWIDPINYQHPLEADAAGIVSAPVLIPGAIYHFTDRTVRGQPSGPPVRREFSVKPGEALELGDILIEKPPIQ
jgi:RNA polymerase sigma factor (sigma-70 family)